VHLLFLDPQKQYADAVIEVLPTQLIPDDNEGKILRVRLIQKEGVKYFSPVYLFDEGSTISWIPCGRKLTCSYPGIKFFYGPESYKGNEVSTIVYSSNILSTLYFQYFLFTTI
jgi:phosphoribulokinase